MLLGQNVNSYGRNFDGREKIYIYKLLQDVSKIEGLERIRFTSPHILYIWMMSLLKSLQKNKKSQNVFICLYKVVHRNFKSYEKRIYKRVVLNRAKKRNLFQILELQLILLLHFQVKLKKILKIHWCCKSS